MENNGRRGVGSFANMVQYRVNRSFLVNDLEVVVRCFRCDFEASIGLVRREKFDLRVDRATCFGPKSEICHNKREGGLLVASGQFQLGLSARGVVHHSHMS